MASLLLNGLNRSEGVYPTSKVGAPSVAKRRVERHARSIPRATFKQGDPLPATPAAKRRVERETGSYAPSTNHRVEFVYRLT